MSKVSSVDYPNYTGSQVNINGIPKASVKYSNGILGSDYNMSDAEKSIYDYSQSTLANILPQLNVFSQDTIDSLKSQTDAYKANGIDTINGIYTPMINDLKNDIASRFGNLDNSMFMDNLNDIESNRSDAISSFAQDVLAKQSELESDELNKRYNFADFLNDLQNQSYNNALNAISSALGGSSTANTYNNNLYNSLYKQYLSNQNSTSNVSSSLLNNLGLSSFL